MRSLPVITFNLFILICGFATEHVHGQGASGNAQNQLESIGQGKVKITQDPVVSNLLELHILQNAKNPGMNGFRIRIFLELGQNARRNSEAVMNAFMEKYPNIRVYQSYDNPYWKISVGDFRTRESAQKLYHQLLVDYPKAFIIPQWINFPPLE
jgi:hypothetical protein